MRDGLPDLFLAGMVGGYGEGHELIERHGVLGIEVEELFRHRSELETLLDGVDRDEEARGNVFLAHALVPECLEGAELVEGMQRCALDVFGERIFLGRYVAVRLAHAAGHRRRAGQPLLLGEKFERPEAAAAGRNLERAGLLAIAIDDRTDVEVLQEAAAGNVLGQVLDRDAGLDAPDVRLGENELVEGDVARGAEGDLLGRCRHGDLLRDGRREPLSRLETRHGNRAQPSHSPVPGRSHARS